MKVLITGATGFLGSHLAEALAAEGHALRVLVRSGEKAERVLGARGLSFEPVLGDMTDVDPVERALEGCEAVVHAAATMYGGADVLDANVAGVRHVLQGAYARRLDPIVYVSTIAAMFPPPGPLITVDDPIASLRTTYGRSKAEGERIARELQARGAPLVSIYPAGIYGPGDPGPGETLKGLRDALRFGWPITSGGISIVDVRDVAAIAVAALRPGRGPRRYMAGGRFLTWREKAELCDALTGVRARRIPAPGPLLRVAGRVLDRLKGFVSFEYPLTYEAALMMTEMKPCDSRATCEELGVAFRPTEVTLADTLRWLHASGELDARHVGRLLA
jgi:nucleoside-diphosphate-sugar epimerase